MKLSTQILLAALALGTGACHNSDETSSGVPPTTGTSTALTGDWESPTPSTGIVFAVYNNRIMGFQWQCGHLGVSGFEPKTLSGGNFSYSEPTFSLSGSLSSNGTGSGTMTANVCGGTPLAWTATKFDTTPHGYLLVAFSGTDGVITSSPAGITCPGTCDGYFAAGVQVTLTATPDPGHTFAGWTGDCSGTGTCVLDMLENQYVSTSGFN